MSAERKALKIICFLYILDAIAYGVVGTLTLGGMGTLSPSDTVAVGGIRCGLQAWAQGLGIWFVLRAAFYLVFAMLGIRGANTPRKIGPFRGLAIGSLVVAIVGAALCVVFHGPASGQSAVPYASMAFSVASIWLAGKIQRQAER